MPTAAEILERNRSLERAEENIPDKGGGVVWPGGPLGRATSTPLVVSPDPATTVTDIGATSVVGTATKYAREDHVHGAAATATPIVIGSTGIVGTSVKYAREDHSHQLALTYDGGLQFSGDELEVAWSLWPADTSDFTAFDGNWHIDWTGLPVSGDFTMSGGTLEHVFESTEPFSSTGFGLYLSIDASTLRTTGSGPSTLEVFLQASGGLLDSGSGIYVDWANGDYSSLMSSGSPTNVDGTANDSGVSGYASRADHQHDLDAGNGLAFAGGALGVDLAGTKDGLAFLSTQLTCDFSDGFDFAFSASVGTKIGTAAAQLIGMWGATPVVQRSHIADPSGGATTDAEARTAIDAILLALEQVGILATA